jgi:hypothetical protein
MKLVKTAMLASAFALATTLAFAQVSVGGSTGAGVNAGSSSQGGSANVNSSTNGNVKAGGVNAHATTGTGVSGDTRSKKHNRRIDGSASDRSKIQLDTK